jgi:hypothetical protein
VLKDITCSSQNVTLAQVCFVSVVRMGRVMENVHLAERVYHTLMTIIPATVWYPSLGNVQLSMNSRAFRDSQVVIHLNSCPLRDLNS